MVLNDLLPDTLGRTEENDPPIFWSKTGEVFPAMVQGMFEAALITGTVQINSAVVTLKANTTYFGVPGTIAGYGYGQGGYGQGGYGGGLQVVQKGVLAPLRMKAPYPIRKATLAGLDAMTPNWQQAAPSTQIIAWGPIGVNNFFIYPQLTADSQVTMDFIVSPINQATPYSGTEVVPFQVEFADLISIYAAVMLRSKEAGAESEEAAVVYDAYLSRIKALSAFQGRLDSLNFTGAYGGRTQANPRTQA